MSESPQHFQVISSEPTTTPQRIQVTAVLSTLAGFKECDSAAAC